MVVAPTQQGARQMIYLVNTYRIDNGAHVAHLDRTFDTVAEARAYALAANCKAYTPFISIVRETAA
jgi:hypothetical protein